MRFATWHNDILSGRQGEQLIVHHQRQFSAKLDRLARSTSDLLAIVARLDAKDVALRILDFGGSAVDTKSPAGKLMLTVFAATAQFEREVMLQRQREGIAAAKAAGKYKGRAPTAKAQSEIVTQLRDEGVGATEIARRLGIGRASVYRILQDADGVAAAA